VYLPTPDPRPPWAPIEVLEVSGIQQVAQSGEFRHMIKKYRKICRFMANGVRFSGENKRYCTLLGGERGSARGSGMGTMERRAVLGTDSGCLDHMQVQGVYPPTLQSGDISDSINPSRGCFLSLFYKKPCLFFRNCSILPRFGVFPGNACPEICLFRPLWEAEKGVPWG